MSDNSLIEWCTATWNFLIGCTKKSAGCMHCYAIRQAWRLMHNPNPKIAKKFEGTVANDSKGELNWTGRINFDEDALALPLHWKLPRRIFVNSLSDLFHPNVKDEWIAVAFGVMMATQHHTYQILTKHPDRAARWFRDVDGVSDQQGLTPREFVEEAALNHVEACHLQADMSDEWPLPNVQILTSVEDQETANQRIPWLLRIPAAVHGISAEPLLGPINLRLDQTPDCDCLGGHDAGCGAQRRIGWVIAGGESGPEARPMHPDWARSLRDQCVAAGVPFFFKQWGAFIEDQSKMYRGDPSEGIFHTGPQHGVRWVSHLGSVRFTPPSTLIPGKTTTTMVQVGKKAAGRLLDGREWNQFPEAKAVTHAA